MRQHLPGGAGGQVCPGDEDQEEDQVSLAAVKWSCFKYEIYIYNFFSRCVLQSTNLFESS